ncbi:hypothetical protein O0L34_g545 [Tuta absoluta]|nr:hypothetical protein O0L34_g545 [Tuta absoluta]
MFVIDQSSDLSNPSSKQLAIERNSNHNTDNIFAKFLKEFVIPDDYPTTSKDLTLKTFDQPPVTESVSSDEVMMADINLQSDHEIPIDDFDDNDSIVLAYLRNRHVVHKHEGTLLISQKMASLLDSVPKLETIEEGEQDPEKSDQTLELSKDSEEHKNEQ